MSRKIHLVLLYVAVLFILLIPVAAQAKFPVVSAEQLKSWMDGKKKVMVIDTRLPEEYREGHIAGAVNIPAERIRADRSKLPGDRSTPLVFYCRGVG